MLKIKRLKYCLAQMLIAMSCLNSCTTIDYEYCPTYPIAGAKVAQEIKDVEGKYFWEWVGRIDKLRQQLDLCQKKEL